MPSTRDINIKTFAPLVPPQELQRRLPMTEELTEHVARSRQTIVDILEGRDERLMLIVGPCSIHDEEAAIDYARRLKELAAEVQDRVFVVMRVYFEKPRTTVGWKGLIYDPHLDGSSDIATGLYRARDVMIRVNELGLPAATEFLDPFVPQYISGLVSWAGIGARTTESQTHRQMASGLSMPVGFKNGTDGETQTAVDAVLAAHNQHTFLGMDYDGNACVVQTLGNPACHLVLRGGRTGPNYSAEHVDKAAQQLAAAGLHQSLLVDCSHGNSNKDHTRQAIAFRDVLEQRANGDRRIAGCMLESHLEAGNQKLGDDPAALVYGKSITDACVSWDETVELVREAYEAQPATGNAVTVGGG
ncbi:MAG: 3-deoxy-7-phosphoheptulonate synthase [Dehalococcoidia bacterium]|nr:3-deoxy-7-phosphoheptulonate synthase [Dehalococcoidia bacterium]